MGTRGTYGFHFEGKDYLTYNHMDSYPDGPGLGGDVVRAVEAVVRDKGIVDALAVMKSKLGEMRFINEHTEPMTDADREKFADWSNTSVSTGDDWYSLVRQLQGDIMGHLVAGIMLDGNDFINDSLFCEYGYIINLDDVTLEFYKGFQSSPHTAGRYAGNDYDPHNEYYPCALVATFPLDAIPEDWLEQAYPEEVEDEDAA